MVHGLLAAESLFKLPRLMHALFARSVAAEVAEDDRLLLGQVLLAGDASRGQVGVLDGSGQGELGRVDVEVDLLGANLDFILFFLEIAWHNNALFVEQLRQGLSSCRKRDDLFVAGILLRPFRRLDPCLRCV